MFSLTHVVYIGKNRYFCRRQNLKIIPMKKQHADEEHRGRNGRRRKPWYGETGENIALIAVFVVLISVFALDRCGNNVHQQQPTSIIMRDTGQTVRKGAAEASVSEAAETGRGGDNPEETARRDGLEDGYNDGMEDGETGENMSRITAKPGLIIAGTCVNAMKTVTRKATMKAIGSESRCTMKPFNRPGNLITLICYAAAWL